MTLGARIKAERQRQGWTQLALARHAGVRQALVSRLESGQQVDTTGSVLCRLARAFGVSVDSLVGMEKPGRTSVASLE